jgi:small subunit ribosomal protein S6
MNSYETVFILTPVLSDDQAKEAVQKFEAEVAAHGGKLTHSEKWGLRKLAYPIQKKTTGFYYLLQYEGAGDVIGKLELAFKRDERVMRFLTVKMDKHHAAFADKFRNKSKEVKPVEAAPAVQA